MVDIVLTSAELALLMGLRGDYVKVYLALRQRMDFSSGIVGMCPRISYQAIRESTESYTPRGTGFQRDQASMREVRGAVDRLISVGLLRRKATEHLVFLLPMARYGKVRPNQTRHEPDRVDGGVPDAIYAGVDNSGNPNDIAWYARFDDDKLPTEHDTNPTGLDPSNPTNICEQIRLPSQQTTTPVCIEGGFDSAAGVVARGLALIADATPAAMGLSESEFGMWQWLQKQGVRCGHSDPKLLALLADEIDHGQIMAAVETAREQRANAGSAQPLNIGLVSSIVRAKKVSEAWLTSDAMANAKAHQLGISPARPGESCAQFHTRIRAAIAARKQA